MILPILVENETKGTINVYRKGKKYTIEELELAETYALLASTSLNNALSHSELEKSSINLEKIVKKRTMELEESNKKLDDSLKVFVNPYCGYAFCG